MDFFRAILFFRCKVVGHKWPLRVSCSLDLVIFKVVVFSVFFIISIQCQSVSKNIFKKTRNQMCCLLEREHVLAVMIEPQKCTCDEMQLIAKYL